MITEQDLQICIKAHRENKIGDKEMLQVLKKLAINVKDYVKFPVDEEGLTEAAEICLVKLAKYDASRGRAFNFLTTIMQCYLRQVYRSSKNIAFTSRAHLKEQNQAKKTETYKIIPKPTD